MDEHNQLTHNDPLINLLFDSGLQNALPRIAEILMNAAMLLEREQHIGAAPTSEASSATATATASNPARSRLASGP